MRNVQGINITNCDIATWSWVNLVNPQCYDATVQVQWYVATMQWCNGATVQWCMQWCNGATVRWCNGATVQWCNSAVVQQCSGAMVQECNSAVVQQCSGATVQQCNGATVHAQWCSGASGTL